MTSKKAPAPKAPSSYSKARSQSRKPPLPAPQPETVKRYSCDFICVMGFPQSSKDLLGPDLLSLAWTLFDKYLRDKLFR